MMDEGLRRRAWPSPTELGRVKRIDDAQARYIEIAKAAFPKAPQPARPAHRHRLRQRRRLQGRADDAVRAGRRGLSGRASSPNGTNINADCGSTHPATLAAAVKEYRADIGIALDGDADRLIICDENGKVVDGDQIMALIGRRLGRDAAC